MAPLIVLVTSALVFWIAGKIGVATFQYPGVVLRAALALMFLLTASAHWGKRRPDLIRMVPPSFSRADLLVTITGLLELLGVIGLLWPPAARITCFCLAALLVALFPANVRAAREKLTIGGRRVPGLPVRSLIQVVFIGTLVTAAVLR
jgi:uncharacterized membrane protein